jgi:hypothetical protein
MGLERGVRIGEPAIVVLQDDDAGQERERLVACGESDELLERILLRTIGKVLRCLGVVPSDLGIAARECGVEEQEVLRVVRFLSDDRRHVAPQLRIGDVLAGCAHRLDQVALEVRDVQRERVDEHCELGAGTAPDDAFALGRGQVESERADRKIVHRMRCKLAHESSPCWLHLGCRQSICRSVWKSTATGRAPGGCSRWRERDISMADRS